jgi:hypothetical protein
LVRLSLVLGSTAVSLALVALAMLVLDLSFARAALLAPVLVASVGAILALLVLWGRAALGQLGRKNQRD